MTPIQFGHITIDGTTYPVKFGTVTSMEFCEIMEEKTKKPFDLADMHALFGDKDEKGRTKLMRLQTKGIELMALVYSALKEGARVTKTPFDLESYKDAGQIVDLMNINPELWAKFFAIMNHNPAEKPDKTKEVQSPNGQAAGMLTSQPTA